MDKNSFLIYLDYEEQFNLLTDEQIGQLIRAVMFYEKTGKLSKLEGTVQMAFSFIKTQLDRDRQKYQAKCEKNRENGAKGGRPKKANGLKKSEGFLEKPKKPDNDNEDEEDNEEDIEKEKKKKRKTFKEVFEEKEISSELKSVLEDFIDMRKTIKKPMTSKALELLINKLRKMSDLEEVQIKMLNISIERGWQTVYPLKSNQNAEEEFLNE